MLSSLSLSLSLSLSRSLFLSFCLFLRLTSSSFDVVWSRRAKNREYERARDGVTLNYRQEEQRWKGIVRKRDVGMPSTLSHFRSPCYRFIKVTMITRELRRPLYLIVPIQRRPKKRTFSMINRIAEKLEKWIWGLFREIGQCWCFRRINDLGI